MSPMGILGRSNVLRNFPFVGITRILGRKTMTMPKIVMTRRRTKTEETKITRVAGIQRRRIKGMMGDEESEEPEEYEEYEESRQKKSSLYDTSVPYSHRKGYTWAGTTANELMAIWQRLPFINLTQPNQRTLS